MSEHFRDMAIGVDVIPAVDDGTGGRHRRAPAASVRLAARSALVALFAVLLVSAVPAEAADGWRGGGFAVQERGQRDRQFAPQRRDDWRDDRRDEGRPPPSYPQRLSPDERRQLRRDLHDANRDMRPRRSDPRR